MSTGEIQFEVYGYADASGNVGTKLTNADINNSMYQYVIFDNIVPEITVKDGENETIGDAVNGYSKISFKIYDDIALAEYDINGEIGVLSVSQWGDINNITSSYKGAVVGENILKVRDQSGNENTLTFKLI